MQDEYLKPLPEPSIDSQPFWDGLKDRRIMLQRCSDCGTIRHYPRPMCDKCHSMECDWVEASGHGTIYSWTESHHPFHFGFKAENRVPYTFNPGPFIADPDSGQQGYITSEPFAIEREGGFKPDIWVIADEGFNTYATLVEAMQATIDTKPEVVKCFVEGSAIGWATYLYGDPTLGNAAIQAQNPEMSIEQIEYSIKMMRDYGIVDSGDALELGIGGMKAETIQSFYDKMVASGVVAAGLDLTKVYSLDFANTGAALPVKKKLLGD